MNKRINRMRSPSLAAVLVASLVSVLPLSQTLADNTLPAAPEESTDGHISWHEFMHELGNYPQITASMSNDGVIVLNGHAGGGVDKLRIRKLADKVRDATEIQSNLYSD